MSDHEVEIENVIDPTKSYHHVLSPDELNVIYIPCGKMARGKADAFCRDVLNSIKEKYDYKILIIPTFDN